MTDVRKRAFAALASFVLMEPATYAAHRWIMHGPGWGWHRSHHEPRRGAFEANDLYPVTFAGATIVTMAVARARPGMQSVMASAVGVTAYGVAYGFVHDAYIHRRFWSHLPEWRALEYLRWAHSKHHADGGEPYGMLLPIVPRSRRKEASVITFM